MVSKDDKEKRLEKMRKKLADLQRQLEENEIDYESKPYMELSQQDFQEVEPNIADANEYERAAQIPEQTDSLSFHDLDCNELALMDLPASCRRNQPPNNFSILKANRIFLHTFLGEYPEANYYRA